MGLKVASVMRGVAAKDAQKFWDSIKDIETTMSLPDVTSFLKDKNGVGIIAKDGDKVVGFLFVEVKADHFHIVNITVRSDVKVQTVLSFLLDVVAAKMKPDGRVFTRLEVRESNLEAQLFLRSKGYVCVEILKSWFRDQNENKEWDEEDAYQFVQWEPEFLEHNKDKIPGVNLALE